MVISIGQALVSSTLEYKVSSFLGSDTLFVFKLNCQIFEFREKNSVHFDFLLHHTRFNN